MAIDQSKSKVFKAVDGVGVMPLNLFLIIKRISFFALIAGVVFFTVREMAGVLPEGMFPPWFLELDRDALKAIIYISFSCWAPPFLVLAFVNQKLARAGKELDKNFVPDENLLEYLDLKAAKIFKMTLAMNHLPFERVLFYKILSSEDISFSLARLMLDRADLKRKLLDGMKYRSKLFPRENSRLVKEMNRDASQRILELACRHAIDNGGRKTTIFDLFLVLAARDREFQNSMDSLELLKDDVESVFLWQMNLESYRQHRKRFWERDNLRLLFALSPVRDFVGGFTITLDRHSRDISTYNLLRQGGVVLHADQIGRMEIALLKQKGNGVLLVGEPGSGRKSIIYNFANRIASETGPISLRAMRIMQLDMVSLAAAYGENELIAAIETIFQEAIRAKNIILVIPGIDAHIGKHPNDRKLASVDISGILSRYLGMPGFRLIGIADRIGYCRSIEPAADIAEKFTKIEVASATAEEAMRVLKEESLRREGKSGLFIPIATLKEIVKLCDYFLAEAAFPEKALALLDDMISNELSHTGKSKKTITPADVDKFFSRKYDTPAGAAGAEEKETLLNLEERIHEGLVNQAEAVSEIANALRRARARIKDRKRTIGNFLFLGPTGCGKTETAKQLSLVYFGSAKNMIRLNMAEYQTIESIDKLIGSPENIGFLASAIRKNPFSLVLVDEIEKSHPGLLNVFLNIFDEGEMTDGFGRKIDFRHAIVIATSNAGAESIKEAVERGQSMAEFKNNLINQLLAQGIFKPEFINRFDAIVLYRSLGKEEMRQVAELMLRETREGLRQRRIEFVITSELARGLAEVGFDPVFGGRAMRRVLQDKVENPIAKALLSGTLNPGDNFTIDPVKWEMVITAALPRPR
jgi:ATP-dependent Clp protease ATP-binding subunit ClpA